MSLQKELGFQHPIENPLHAAMLSVVLTGSLLVKEGHRIMRPFGITDAQFNVLMLLKYQSENGELNQTTLGRMLLVNRSNITGLTDRLEQAGLVQRVMDATDRRVNRVRLTQEGRSVLDRSEQAYFARVKEIMGTLSEKENAQLNTFLERVRKQLRTR
ncbi:MAG TPA: MarR family transcriptional regulator [bacterium]|nr:MarR family transcriptional regulator [bacterium]